MKSTPELEAEILRLHHAEQWPPGTIATQLGAHVDQVQRVLGLDTPRVHAERQLDLPTGDNYIAPF